MWVVAEASRFEKDFYTDTREGAKDCDWGKGTELAEEPRGLQMTLHHQVELVSNAKSPPR
jgi:hypothetical protein